MRLRRRRGPVQAAGPGPAPDRSATRAPGRVRRGWRWVRAHVSLRSGRTWDALLGFVALVLFVVTWSTVLQTHRVDEVAAPAVAVLTAGPLLLVRRYPLAAWAGTEIVGGYLWAVFDPRPGFELPWPVPLVIVLFVAVVAVALRERLRVVPLVWLASVVTLLLLMPGDVRDGLAFGLTSATVVALLVRWLIVSRLQLAQQEEVSELERARRAVLEERARIARDLHDVVAHRMSMVVVQAESAPARLGEVAPEAADEFRSIAEQARSALNEVRGMLGVLRSEDAGVASTPQVSARDVDRLLEQTRAAGVDLAWSATGDPEAVGDAVGLALYRILQEALANASRHAPGSRVRVEIRYGDPVRLSVHSSVPPAGESPARHPRTGTGLVGMRDRARSVGGQLEAGRAPDGGFLVRATLPATMRDAV